MNFFTDEYFEFVLMALILADASVFYFTYKKNSIKLTLQWHLIFYTILMAFLMFSLPDYSSRANLQLVEKLSDLDTNEKLMVYVQQNNQTVAKTIKVLHYTLFFSAIFLGVILKTTIKNLKNDK